MHDVMIDKCIASMHEYILAYAKKLKFNANLVSLDEEQARHLQIQIDRHGEIWLLSDNDLGS